METLPKVCLRKQITHFGAFSFSHCRKNRPCLALQPLFGPIADTCKLTFLTNITVCLNFPFLLTLPATYFCWLNAGFKSVNTSQIDTPFLRWFENVRTSTRFSGCKNRISLCLMNWKINTQSSTLSSPVNTISVHIQQENIMVSIVKTAC